MFSCFYDVTPVGGTPGLKAVRQHKQGSLWGQTSRLIIYLRLKIIWRNNKWFIYIMLVFATCCRCLKFLLFYQSDACRVTTYLSLYGTGQHFLFLVPLSHICFPAFLTSGFYPVHMKGRLCVIVRWRSVCLILIGRVTKKSRDLQIWLNVMKTTTEKMKWLYSQRNRVFVFFIFIFPSGWNMCWLVTHYMCFIIGSEWFKLSDLG